MELEIDYKRNPQLIDPPTGAKLKPSELLDLAKVINPTPEYIAATSAQQRLYDLEYYLNFENPFLTDYSYADKQDLLVSGWPVANQTLCGSQLQWITKQLDEHQNYTLINGQLAHELTALMDSFGRLESGLYSGVVNWLGSYERCSRTKLDGGRIKTRYCTVRLQPRQWPTNETMYQKTTIRLGVCLPETCDTLSFRLYNSSIGRLAKLELTDFYRSQLELHSMYCLPDERSPIRRVPLSGRIYLCIVGGWIVLVVIASVIYELSAKAMRKEKSNVDYYAKSLDVSSSMAQTISQRGDSYPDEKSFSLKLLEALSLRCNLKGFKTNSFRVKYKQGHRVRVNLGCLDFLKVLMALLVVLGHSSYLASVYARSLVKRIDLSVSELARLALSIPRCVDTFFVIFGVLTTYTLLRKFTVKQLSRPTVWLSINLGILLRITPIFMLVYWYSKSVSPYTGSGPWWDYGVDHNSIKGICMSDPWWKSIPYLGSFGLPPTCVPPAWFIVSYSQISLILPLITYILCKLPNYVLRSALAGLLLVVSASSIGVRLYKQTSVREEAFSLYGGFLTDLLEKFESTGYMTTLGRVGSVSIGCFVGYLLSQYEDGNIKNWPTFVRTKTTLILVSLAHILIILLPLISHGIYLLTGKMTTLGEFIAGNVSVMIAWPILNAIIILNATTIYNHTVVIRFLSHSFWHSFNRLGFIIFLIHWEILTVGITNSEQAPGYGFVGDAIKMWTSSVSLSIALAIVIYMFVEAPMSRLLLVMLNSTTTTGESVTHNEAIEKVRNGSKSVEQV